MKFYGTKTDLTHWASLISSATNKTASPVKTTLFKRRNFVEVKGLDNSDRPTLTKLHQSPAAHNHTLWSDLITGR